MQAGDQPSPGIAAEWEVARRGCEAEVCKAVPARWAADRPDRLGTFCEALWFNAKHNRHALHGG